MKTVTKKVNSKLKNNAKANGREIVLGKYPKSKQATPFDEKLLNEVLRGGEYIGSDLLGNIRTQFYVYKGIIYEIAFKNDDDCIKFEAKKDCDLMVRLAETVIFLENREKVITQLKDEISHAERETERFSDITSPAEKLLNQSRLTLYNDIFFMMSDMTLTTEEAEAILDHKGFLDYCWMKWLEGPHELYPAIDAAKEKFVELYRNKENN